jgi:hypothetical protein
MGRADRIKGCADRIKGCADSKPRYFPYQLGNGTSADDQANCSQGGCWSKFQLDLDLFLQAHPAACPGA